MVKEVKGRERGGRAGENSSSSRSKAPRPRKILESEANDTLRQEIAAHAATRAELARVRAEAKFASRECEELKSRVEIAFRGAGIHAFAQDRDLRYTWVSGPRGADPSILLGRTDDELWASPEQQSVVALKRRVLETGKAEDCEVFYITPDRRALFALHVDPVFADDGEVGGVLCTAVDISRIRSLESEQRRLTEDLATAAQRYEFALRGSNVAVFTQDKDLRYTSVSKPLFDLTADAIHGRTDAELLPDARAEALIALKKEVLREGAPRDAEVRIETGKRTRWYDLHIEPMRDVSGSLVGLTGAAIDITDRKEGEAHLRLLMRELTHRSKNLLAVIQAMAHQTARHTGTIEQFLERFSARVQALSRSHDLLVQESWHGASLENLVRSHLAYYLEREPERVSIGGPNIRLKPEAAQSLGLALHELAANAARHGALSRSGGRVHVSWKRADRGVELVWRESRGPKVSAPKRRGFGSMVIEHNLTRALDAEVSLDFAADGLTCRVLIPQNHLATRMA